MNGQTNFNNQVNNQFNNQPVNNGVSLPVNPTNNVASPVEGHVKKKFFSSAFLNNNDNNGINTNINDVGGTSSAVNNSVINWGANTNNLNVVNNQSTVIPNPTEMLGNVNGTIVIDEPEVLEDVDLPDLKDNVEKLDEPDVLDEVQPMNQPQFIPQPANEPVPQPQVMPQQVPAQPVQPEMLNQNTVAAPVQESLVQVPTIDQGITTQPDPSVPAAPVVNPDAVLLNQQPAVGVFKPQTELLEQDTSLGYQTKGVDPSVLNNIAATPAVPVAPVAPVAQVGVGMAAGIGAMQMQPPSIEQSAIFQAAQNNQPTQVVQHVEDNSPAQQWMASQPLSAGNIEDSTIKENNVISANKREEMEKKAKEAANTKAVPDEVIKPKEPVVMRKDLLAKEYVGEDYTSFVMSPFNFGAFIFGAAYFGYRKLIIWALINIVAAGGILFYVPFKYSLIALLGFHILMGLAFNRIFVIHVKILAAIAAKKNSRKKKPRSEEEMEEIMRYRGRPSVLLAFLAICLFLSGVVFYAMKIQPELYFSKLVNKAFGGGLSKIKELTFNGEIVYDEKEKISDYLNISVPDVFTGKIENQAEYSYTIEGDGTFRDCSLKVGVIKDFENGNSYVVKMAAFNNEPENVKSIDGKIQWTNYSTEDEMYRTYYFGTTIKEHAILYEFRIGKDSNKEMCETYNADIMDRLEIKED